MTPSAPRAAVAGLAAGAAIVLSGCFATEKHVELIETDVTQQAAWNDERFQQLSGEISQVRAENEALRQRMDDLSDQLASLGGEVSTRLTELVESDQEVAEQALEASRSATDLESKRQRDREELLNKMNAILEEVLRENERLDERVQRLEDSALTFGRTHRVQPGESVAQIARKYGVTVEAIVAANGLADASLIRVGQELIVPGLE